MDGRKSVELCEANIFSSFIMFGRNANDRKTVKTLNILLFHYIVELPFERKIYIVQVYNWGRGC